MLVEPTAPNAVEPEKRPTTAKSDILNKTCNKLEAIKGRLKTNISFARGPAVKSLTISDSV